MLNAEDFKAVVSAHDGQHTREGYRAVKNFFFCLCWNLYVDATSVFLSAKIDTLLRPCGNNSDRHTQKKNPERVRVALP